MLVAMAFSVRFHDDSKRCSRPLITSLIIVLLSAMLFMVGLACASFEKADGAGISPPSDTAQSLQSSETGLVVSGIKPDADQRGTASFDISLGSSALLESVFCGLGLLCGLVFLILLSRLWQRPLLRDLGPSLLLLRSLALPSCRPRKTVLSLTQLSLSRT